MNCTQKITEDLFWIGGSDRRLALFENIYPIPEGVSYNSYLLRDEKNVLFDTVDKSVERAFFENLEAVLNGQAPDYLVVSHMEPDHAAVLQRTVEKFPEIRLVCNRKTLAMIGQFFQPLPEERVLLVQEGDTLSVGRHTLHFVMAPMVHWPEVMVTYDSTDKVLFSADAFGAFGAFHGTVLSDDTGIDRDEMRRYYTNIVGKYGSQVQALLNKAQSLEIETVCPLHGPVLRSGLEDIFGLYRKWSSYMPEENGVLIAYASVYGGTERAAEMLAGQLAERGVRNLRMYDVSVTHPSYLLAQAFRYSHVVLAGMTYNAGVFPPMETFLREMISHNLQNRTFAVLENGTWAPTVGKQMRELLSALKNVQILDETVSFRSVPKSEHAEALGQLAQAIADSLEKPESSFSSSAVDSAALFRLSYGLFVLTAKNGEKDNGCIINTAMQITSQPQQILIAVNKQNYTHDMIKKTGVFNLSVLSTSVPFRLFQHFGFQSGRTADKFAEFRHTERSENGLLYLNKYANALLSGKVVSSIDAGSHTMFLAEVTQAKILSEEPSVTYEYYFTHIKPAPAVASARKKGYVCKICGYVYEGDSLPQDFVCPLCKHGTEDFEPLS